MHVENMCRARVTRTALEYADIVLLIELAIHILCTNV